MKSLHLSYFTFVFLLVAKSHGRSTDELYANLVSTLNLSAASRDIFLTSGNVRSHQDTYENVLKFGFDGSNTDPNLKCGSFWVREPLPFDVLFGDPKFDWNLKVKLNLQRGEFFTVPPDGVAIWFADPNAISTNGDTSGFWGTKAITPFSGFGVVFETHYSSISAPGSIEVTAVGGLEIYLPVEKNSSNTCTYYEWEFQDDEERSIFRIKKQGRNVKATYGRCEFEFSVIPVTGSQVLFGIVGCAGSVYSKHQVLGIEFSRKSDFEFRGDEIDDSELKLPLNLSNFDMAAVDQLDRDLIQIAGVFSGSNKWNLLPQFSLAAASPTGHLKNWQTAGRVQGHRSSGILTFSGSSYSIGFAWTKLPLPRRLLSADSAWQVDVTLMASSDELIGIDGWNFGFTAARPWERVVGNSAHLSPNFGIFDGFGVAARFYHFYNYTYSQKAHIYALMDQDWRRPWPEIGYLNGSVISECVLHRQDARNDYQKIRMMKIGSRIFVDFGRCSFGLGLQSVSHVDDLHLTFSAWSGVSPRRFQLLSISFLELVPAAPIFITSNKGRIAAAVASGVNLLDVLKRIDMAIFVVGLASIVAVCILCTVLALHLSTRRRSSRGKMFTSAPLVAKKQLCSSSHGTSTSSLMIEANNAVAVR